MLFECSDHFNMVANLISKMAAIGYPGILTFALKWQEMVLKQDFVIKSYVMNM